MPRTAIAVNIVPRNGALATVVWTTVDHVNDHEWTPANARDILLIQRGNTAGDNTYEVVSAANANGRQASAAQELITSTSAAVDPSVDFSYKGPFKNKGWIQSDGKIYVNNLVDDGADTRIAVLRLPLGSFRLPGIVGATAVPSGSRTAITAMNLLRPEEDHNADTADAVIGGFRYTNTGQTIAIYSSLAADSMTIKQPPDGESRVEDIAFSAPGTEGNFRGVSVVGPLDPKLFNYADGRVHVNGSGSTQRCQAIEVAPAFRI